MTFNPRILFTFFFLACFFGAYAQEETESMWTRTAIEVEEETEKETVGEKVEEWTRSAAGTVKDWTYTVADKVHDWSDDAAGAVSNWWHTTADWCRRYDVFDNLELSATLGTTGIGFEAATPITRWTRLRAGVDWIPSVKVPMTFSINTYNDGIANENFEHVQEMVYNLTGIEIDEKVKMKGKPYWLTFHLLVDVFPFRENRHWHFTGGFYLGGNLIARAYNDPREKPTLVGLNIYNRAYEYFSNITDIFDVPLGGDNYMDPSLVVKMQERFRRYGRMGMHIGDFKDGTPYIMEPASDGSLSARGFVKRFRPYLGFGYSGNLDSTGKWQIGVEAGAIFWGGIPDVYDQNGVNLTKDLINVRGKVGDYIRVFRALPVYPAIDLRISYTFF